MQIGTGHFMRCLALAGALQRAGVVSRFVCRHAPEFLRAMAREAGHGFEALETTPLEDAGDLPHSAWLCTTQRIDAAHTVRALSTHRNDWLVVDHYALDARWETAVRDVAHRIFVIDDLADRDHQCDALLDQNLFPDMQMRYAGRAPRDCRLLFGPTYALLRDEFSRLRKSTRVRRGPARRILVLMGGVDASNQTEKAVEAIARLQGRILQVDVVIGTQHPARERLADLCGRYGFSLHVQTAELAELMRSADLAIGAAGSSSWERCCLGLPTICVGLAAHQLAMAEGLQSSGAIVNLGNAAEVSVEDLAASLSSLIEQPDRLASLSSAASRLVDGKGAERVSRLLMSMA